jgi:hypothetical protein
MNSKKSEEQCVVFLLSSRHMGWLPVGVVLVMWGREKRE